MLAVLADGTIDHPNGRRAAVLAVEYYLDAMSHEAYSGYTNLFALETAMQANRYVQSSVFTGRSPRLSLTVALFTKGEMRYFNVGTNKIFLYDGINERIIGGDATSSYSSGKQVLFSKNIVGIMSVGVHVSTHPMDRIRIIESKKIKIFDKAQAVVEFIDKKGLSNQLNATALLVEVVR